MMPRQEDASNDGDDKAAKSPPSTGPGTGDKAGAASSASSPQDPAASQDTDAITLLKADHRKVEALFAKYASATSGKQDIVHQICTELTLHTTLEEELFYPACRRAASDEEPLDEAQVEHDSAKVLIADLMNGSGQDRFRDAKISVLAEQIKHHVAEEEAPAKGIFARAEAAGVNTPELARQLQERRRALLGDAASLAPSRPVSFQIFQFQAGQTKEHSMANYRGNERDRDERGRFIDEDRGGRGGRARDDDGRYSARDDDDGGRGWYGDSRGHSEASRRGWAERSGGSRSFRDDDDDRRYGARSYDRERDDRGRFISDEDDRGYGARAYDRERDDRGRFMSDDDRGYGSRSYDRGRDERGRFTDDDRGYRTRNSGERERDDRGRFVSDDDDRESGGRDHGGWYGDSRGHAEAARRGWEDRDGGRSRSRDEDDRGGRRGSRDHGGWFGDPRGHAEAARRGWQDRR